ncbi:MAG TPA: sulfur transferase domain-containing protein [Gemmatimonadaceae bacterium]|nr:sulfur transferase domain-containing protein [Gemmatimonadaceae bacterium]
MAFAIVKMASIAAIMSTMATGLCSAQYLTGAHPSGEVPAPVVLDNAGLFQDKFAQVGDDVFIAGQPTEKGLRELRSRGVTTVVNLRTPPEMAKVPFDEPALARELGMDYVNIPMRGTSEMPYSPAALKQFADVMTNAKGKVLLHCTVAWRASHLWAAYLIQYRNVPVATALKDARMINLMDDMRMGDSEQPVESFLGRALPEVGHPKH